MNRVLQTFNKQKISMRRQINMYIDTQAENFGATLPQIIWSNRDKQNRLNEILSQEVERLNAKVQREVHQQLEDAATILELELKSFTEVKFDASEVDADSFKKILAQLDEIKAQPVQAIVPTGEGDSKVDAASIGVAAGLATESATAIATQLAKTEVGKAIAKSALGKVLGSVVPVIGPVVTIISTIGLLGKIFGGNDDRAKLDAQLAAQNRAERRRVEAQMQARQELSQKCHYLADKLAEELKTATNAAVAEILAKYEEPFKTEIESRKTEDEQIAYDIATLRAIHNEYDLLRVELGAR